LSDEHLDLRAGRNLILRQMRAQWLVLTIAFTAGPSWGVVGVGWGGFFFIS